MCGGGGAGAVPARAAGGGGGLCLKVDGGGVTGSAVGRGGGVEVGTPAVMLVPVVAVYAAMAVCMVESRKDWSGGLDAYGARG